MNWLRFNKKLAGIGLVITGITFALLSYFIDVLRGETTELGYVQWFGLVLGILICLLGLEQLIPRLILSLTLALFVAGIGLTVLNIYGELTSLRSPALPATKLSPEQVYPQLDREPDESVEHYAHRLTQLIHDAR